MTRPTGRCGRLLLAIICTAGLLPGKPAAATDIVLRDGRVLRGSVVPLASISAEPSGEGARRILLIDTQLARYFVPYPAQVAEIREAPQQEVLERFQIYQKASRGGRRIARVGPPLQVEPFDKFGHRIFRMATEEGPLSVVQGITLVTPHYTKVEGISHVWDQRIATTSIPRDTLSRILWNAIDPQNVDLRLQIARLYLQGERYRDARAELEQIAKDFPEVQQQVEPVIRSLQQLSARRIVSEINLRRQAGQHRLAVTLLEQFPTEGVAGEILQEVREILDEYRAQIQRGRDVLTSLKAHYDQLPSAQQEEIKPLLDELALEMNLNTLDRLSAYERLADDASLLPEEKVALAATGWLLGSDAASVKFPTAVSLHRVRGLVRKYMAEPLLLHRREIVRQLEVEEAAAPPLVARLIAHMRPPVESETPEVPGFYKFSVPTVTGQPDIDYYVQLPPEYDPYRRYPAVVTLHGAGMDGTLQIDWWAGSLDDQQQRTGQATRHGMIVVAPDWAQPHQRSYQYSAREHAAVLNALRDACRRFSIDTDRVFLSGHSMGGDAAWDIGLSHPDLWAGLIPITAASDRYCRFYWENARHLPMYFVCGELDGDRMSRNAIDFDRYLHHGYNVTIAEFLGRGHEHFSDEILNLFDWMGRQKRNFYPKTFDAGTLRTTDHFFWWVEVDGLPPKTVVPPEAWDQKPRGLRPATISATINENNVILVRSAAARGRVYLTPEMIDFNQPLLVRYNGRQINRQRFVEPDLGTLLEDVRTRADRQHPFWVVLDSQQGQTAAAP